MDEVEDDTGAGSHTLVYLRRIDRRITDVEKKLSLMIELLMRQQTKVDRVERDIRELSDDLNTVKTTFSIA